MDKNKMELLVLICLIAFGVNYSAFSLYIEPRYKTLKEERAKFHTSKDMVDELKYQENRLQEIRQESESLKEKIAAIDESIPKDMDTPQLAEDFYNSCKEYGIIGESVIFSGGEMASEGEGNLTALPIILRVRGNKYKVEEYLKDINQITKRKLNVEGITIYTEDTAVDFSSGLTRGLTLVEAENIKAEITFTQYIQAGDTTGD